VRASEVEGREGGAAPPKDEKQVPKTQRSCTWYLIRIVSNMDKMTSAGAELIFNSIDDASAVLELARKYEMDAIIYRIGDFIAARFLPTHSLSVYAMSCLAGWQHHARTAAARSLEIRDLGRPSSGFAGMGAISALRLLP